MGEEGRGEEGVALDFLSEGLGCVSDLERESCCLFDKFLFSFFESRNFVNAAWRSLLDAKSRFHCRH